MGRLSFSLLCALSCHAFIMLLPVSRDKPVIPRLTGTNTIKINLTTAVSAKPKPAALGKKQQVTEEGTFLNEAEVEPMIVPEKNVQQPEQTVQHAGEPVQLERESSDLPNIKPRVRKIRLVTATTDNRFHAQQDKEKQSVTTRNELQSYTKDAGLSAPAIVKAKPLYNKNPKPAYPPLARRRDWQGTVILAVEVLKDGSTGRVILHKSSGYELLDTTAHNTVKTWHFIPPTKNGRPAPMEVFIPVHFRIE